MGTAGELPCWQSWHVIAQCGVLAFSSLRTNHGDWAGATWSTGDQITSLILGPESLRLPLSSLDYGKRIKTSFSFCSSIFLFSLITRWVAITIFKMLAFWLSRDLPDACHTLSSSSDMPLPLLFLLPVGKVLDTLYNGLSKMIFLSITDS